MMMKCFNCGIVLDIDLDDIENNMCSDCEDELNDLLEIKSNKIKPVKPKMRKIKLTDY